MSPVERVEYFIPTCHIADGGCGAFVGEQYTDPREADDEQLEHDLTCSVDSIRRSAERRAAYRDQVASGAPRLTEAIDSRVTPGFAGELSSPMDAASRVPAGETPTPVSEHVGEIAAQTQGAQ